MFHNHPNYKKIEFLNVEYALKYRHLKKRLQITLANTCEHANKYSIMEHTTGTIVAKATTAATTAAMAATAATAATAAAAEKAKGTAIKKKVVIRDDDDDMYWSTRPGYEDSYQPHWSNEPWEC